MRRRSKLFIIILLVLTAAVIIYALFFMGRSSETTEVSLPSPGQTGGVSQSDAPGLTETSVNAGNVQAVLSGLSRAESYTAAVTVEDFWPGGSSSQELQVWVDGGRTRIRGEIGESTRNVLISDGMLYIWYDSVSGLLSMPSEQNSDRWMRAVSYEDVLSLPAENILDAGYQMYGGTNCIYVEYIEGDESYVNQIYVSVSTGLLAGAQSTEDGELIYRMNVTVSDLMAPDASLFSPPEN